MTYMAESDVTIAMHDALPTGAQRQRNTALLATMAWKSRIDLNETHLRQWASVQIYV